MTCHLLTHQNPSPCGSEEHGCPLKEVTRTGKPAQMVHTHFMEDVEPRLFRVHGVPIKDETGPGREDDRVQHRHHRPDPGRGGLDDA